MFMVATTSWANGVQYSRQLATPVKEKCHVLLPAGVPRPTGTYAVFVRNSLISVYDISIIYAENVTIFMHNYFR